MYGKDTAFCLQSHIVMCCFVKPYKIAVMQQLMWPYLRKQD